MRIGVSLRMPGTLDRIAALMPRHGEKDHEFALYQAPPAQIRRWSHGH